MLVPLNNPDWRVLRAAVRAGTEYPNGRALRLTLDQRSKNGSFLTRLVEIGLLRVVTKHDDPFQATYTLTEAGERAAEYGEYEIDIGGRPPLRPGPGEPVVTDAGGRQILGPVTPEESVRKGSVHKTGKKHGHTQKKKPRLG